jgi:peptidoglycan/LPS O-acetylase OafA/YrhL
LAAAGLTRRRYFVLFAVGALLGLELFDRSQTHIPNQFEMLGVFAGPLLVVSFLCGVAIYFYRKEVIMGKWTGILSVVFSLFLLRFDSGDVFATIPISYMTIWIGLSNFPKTSLIRHADYSYGVFLYGHVIQQTYSYLFPDYRIWWLNALVCVPATMMFAALSWKCVEKPALTLKTSVYRMEASYLRWRMHSHSRGAVHQVLNEDAQ